MVDLPKAYEPKDVEPRWYQSWIDAGVFRANDEASDERETYVIVLPPPNVTGSLHMGHALMGTLEDVLIRHNRMRGKNTLWQPGMDHAGIATQLVVERQLRREGLSRHDIGREEFVRRVWQWKKESGGRITEQMRALGCSMDWGRSKFTLDPDMGIAVKEAFVRLYEDQLIYRDTRLINWCSDCRTALSDLEVENEEANGAMYDFAYPVVDADAAAGATELVVSTTRPETMLGDTAVAVHPDDPRYRHLHGKKLRHPFVDREIPVITDDILVDMEFGTGAVKVTPAHDFNDFATGKRHGLEEISILELDGTISKKCGDFAGLTVKEARKAVRQKLAAEGLERGSKQHKLQLPHCQRCGTIVEPMISTQWFVKTKPLAEPALEAVRDGRTEIIPAEWVKTYEHWMTNIQDWCISRQLWWGHQIPAWHCDNDHITVTRDENVEKCSECGSSKLERDPDVLDTWFSSGLWPFSTLGWPEKTPALQKFYPSSDMETGYDILFFWVARMMMMGLHFMGDVPFRRVLLHGMVVDETGAKMSKVKGNTIDPLDLISGATFETVTEKALPGAPAKEATAKFRKAYPSTAQMGKGFPAFGTDALRFTLCSYSPQAKRIALSPARVEGYRNFCNKIYNAVRYSLDHIEGVQNDGKPPASPALLPNRWVLSRLAGVVDETSKSIDEFRLDEGLRGLYQFFWDEFCDWYLELSKPVFTSGTDAEKAETRQTLAHVVETALRALHPFGPFITEELWQKVPRSDSSPASIAVARYPSSADGKADADAERHMKIVMSAIGAARTVRSEHEVHPSARIPLRLRAASDDVRQLLESQSRFIATLVKTDGDPVIEAPGAERPRGSVLAVAGDVEALVGLKGLVDAATESDRIERKKKKIQKELEGLDKRLANPKFVDNAPGDVVAEAREKRAALAHQAGRLEEAQALVDELGDAGQ